MFFPTISSHILTALYLVNVLFAFTVIFLERRNPTSTLAWILVLFLLPGAGAVLYLLLSQNYTRKKLFHLGNIELRNNSALLDRNNKRLQAGLFRFNDPVIKNYQDLILLHQLHSKAIFSQDNSILVLTDGCDKFKELFDSILNAQDHIHLQYFIIKRDSLGKQLIEVLTRKANEGVKVKLLVDALGNRLKNSDLEPLRLAGGEIAKFFPSVLSYINLRLNYRNHRKLAIIDGKYGFVGGFNVGDEYLGLNKKMGYWRDTHLKITGTAVQDLQSRFLLDWEIATGGETVRGPEYFPETEPCGTSGIQIVSSGPDTPQEDIKLGYIKMINSAKKSICIQTPYFIPDESIQEALKLASLSGVDVKIMIPDKPDHIFVYWATYSFIGDLLQAGVRAYTYGKGFLHAKTIAIDGNISSVGTANFDIRSFKLNFEINAFIYDPKVSESLQQSFNQDISFSEELTMEKYLNRSNMIKFKESISRLLTPVL